MRALFFGLGGIGQRHLRILREIQPNIELAAVRMKGQVFEISDDLVADRNVDIMNKYDIREFASIDDGLTFQPDLAIVANPTSFHIDTVRRQNLLDTKWPELRETLAHQVVL